MCLAANSIGNSIPQMFIVPRKSFHSYFVTHGPPSCKWFRGNMNFFNSSIIADNLQTILDNHNSLIQTPVIIVVETMILPPLFHPSHKLQPLDRTVFGPFKTFFNKLSNWRKITLQNVLIFTSRHYFVAINPYKMGLGALAFMLLINLFSQSKTISLLMSHQLESVSVCNNEQVQHDEDFGLLFISWWRGLEFF